MHRTRLPLLLLAVVAVLTPVGTIRAQEVEDTIRIKTRVVFLDALVKDRKTNLPISNLAQENFEVLDDGKPRDISYFTREGEARKPLALIMILDLREDGAGRFLKETEILKSMENELAKLPPGDEVAIMAMNIGEDEQRVWLSEFTNDRAKIADALKQVQALCLKNYLPAKEVAEKSTSDVEKKDAESAPKPAKTVVSTENIQGRDGTVITRKTMSDGTVNVQRVTKGGRVSIDLGDTYDMAAAVREATRKGQELRPNSQMSLVWVSDGIVPIFFEDRDAVQEIITRDNVIFNSLTVELRTLFKFLLPIGKPIAGWMGMSLYGSAKQLAQRSGGEAVKVGRVKDYGAGLSRIIGNLTARYSLGFTLAESETDDGRLHHLEVRVKAPDEKGKKRKLQVSSRQGYYMTTTVPKEVRASAQ
jgi:VWFA-related protein